MTGCRGTTVALISLSRMFVDGPRPRFIVSLVLVLYRHKTCIVFSARKVDSAPYIPMRLIYIDQYSDF